MSSFSSLSPTIVSHQTSSSLANSRTWSLSIFLGRFHSLFLNPTQIPASSRNCSKAVWYWNYLAPIYQIWFFRFVSFHPQTNWIFQDIHPYDLSSWASSLPLYYASKPINSDKVDWFLHIRHHSSIYPSLSDLWVIPMPHLLNFDHQVLLVIFIYWCLN